MVELDYEKSLYKTGGGGPRGGRGGCFHLSFRSGSRAGGACARTSYEYVTRSGEYGDDPDRDDLVYTESGHMPAWAADHPEDFWDAGDLYERANGRLYVSADFALPIELDREAQIELAEEFAHELTDKEQLPYTLAIHAGRDEDGQEHNPHAHLMFSERRNDGIERSREDWFGRANREHPELGGAPKSRTFHGSEWVERARERWADLANAALERAGSATRVDHRSYERQGIDLQPGEHYGPSAAHVVTRGHAHERLSEAVDLVDDHDAVRQIDDQISRLEAAREAVLRDGVPEEEPERKERDYSHSDRGDVSDERSHER
jgi:hypothetical protein